MFWGAVVRKEDLLQRLDTIASRQEEMYRQQGSLATTITSVDKTVTALNERQSAQTQEIARIDLDQRGFRSEVGTKHETFEKALGYVRQDVAIAKSRSWQWSGGLAALVAIGGLIVGIMQWSGTNITQQMSAAISRVDGKIDRMQEQQNDMSTRIKLLEQRGGKR